MNLAHLLAVASKVLSGPDHGVRHAFPPAVLLSNALEEARQAAYRAAYSILKHEADSWEAVDQACLEIAAHPKEPHNFRALLIERTKYRAYDILRKRRTRGQESDTPDACPAKAEPPSARQEEREKGEVVWASLDVLTPVERKLVIMHYYEGKAYKQISQETGMPESEIGQHLFSARKKLKAELAGNAAVID